ncbi:MAG: hypothetical protein ABII00_11510 [Elusimicrobiota bacterium]
MPYRPVGRYDDLLMLLARALRHRNGGSRRRKPPLWRLLWEPWFHLFGMGSGLLLRLLPPDMMLAALDRLNLFLEGGKPSYPFDPDSPGLREAAALSREVERETGRPAALLCTLAHAPVEEDLLYLNIELFRHGLLGLRAVRGRPCRPRLVNAIDAFALDMLPLHEEGAYSGIMGTLHLGFDRMPSERSWPGRLLLGRNAWPSVAARIRRQLSGGGEAIIVPAGGVPSTARIFYCAREFVGRLCRRGPYAADPGRVRAWMEREEPGFEAFLWSGAVGPRLGRSLWRLLEAWVLSRLMEGDGLDCAQRGSLSEGGRRALRLCALAIGRPPEEADRIVGSFEAEFARENPYRERFFEFIVARVVARGTPVVVLPLKCGSPESVRIAFGSPLALAAAPVAHALPEGARHGAPAGVDAARGRSVRLLRPGTTPCELPVGRVCREFVGAGWT